MKTFKQFISENSMPDYFFKTKEEIEEWLSTVDDGSFHIIIEDDLTLIARGSPIVFYPYDLINYNDNPEYKVLPVQFKRCNGSFRINSCRLVSLIGCPIGVEGEFTAFGNPALTSLEGCPKRASSFDFGETNIKSFKGINKLVDYTAKFFIPEDYSAGLLSFVLVKGLKQVKARSKTSEVVTEDKPLINALDILNKHLVGGRDVIDLQQELIDSGLKQFANL